MLHLFITVGIIPCDKLYYYSKLIRTLFVPVVLKIYQRFFATIKLLLPLPFTMVEYRRIYYAGIALNTTKEIEE